MNENPEGTPNPLNNKPNITPVDEILDANPSEPMQEESVVAEETVVSEVPPMENELKESEPESNGAMSEQHEPMATEMPEMHQEPTPIEVPVVENTTVVAEAQSEMAPDGKPMVQRETVAATNITVGSLDPTGRAMEKTAPPIVDQKSNHKKKGLAFVIIGCILLIIGIAAAVAAVVLMTNKSDPVNAAMQKIMSGQAPKNVAIDGDINILINDPTALIRRVNIDLDSDTVVGSMINTSSAVLTLTDRSNNDYSAKFNEVYAANGDLFFKIEGATALLEDSHVLDMFVSGNTVESQDYNCITDENGETNCTDVVVDCDTADGTDCVEVVESGTVTSTEASAQVNNMLGMVASIVEAADGVWLRISTEDLNLTDGSGTLGNSNISCITDLVSDVNKNSNSAFDMYNKYPFIVSSDKNVLIASKQNTVYQISVDSKAFTNYINAIGNTDLARSLYSCMGWNNNASVTESDVSEIVNAMPKIYAEVNSENNFTRLYLESDINDGAAHATIDLGFSYPTNVNVTEPVEYTDYAEFVQTLFTSMYNMEGATVEVTEQSN